MDKRNRDLNTDSWQDPWNADFYETGSTRPPKKHRGLLALVLVAGIILGSVLTAFGGINFKKLTEWNRENQENTLPLSLHSGSEDATTAPSLPDAPEETVPSGGDLAVQLNPAPQGVATVTQEGYAYSLQKVFYPQR